MLEICIFRGATHLKIVIDTKEEMVTRKVGGKKEKLNDM